MSSEEAKTEMELMLAIANAKRDKINEGSEIEVDDRSSFEIVTSVIATTAYDRGWKLVTVEPYIHEEIYNCNKFVFSRSNNIIEFGFDTESGTFIEGEVRTILNSANKIIDAFNQLGKS